MDAILSASEIIAPITAITMLIPQIFDVWRIRNSPEKIAGISIGTQIMLGINSIMWLLMGASMQSFSVAAASFVTLPIIIFTFYIIIRSKWVTKQARKEKENNDIDQGNKSDNMTEINITDEKAPMPKRMAASA